MNSERRCGGSGELTDDSGFPMLCSGCVDCDEDIHPDDWEEPARCFTCGSRNPLWAGFHSTARDQATSTRGPGKDLGPCPDSFHRIPAEAKPTCGGSLGNPRPVDRGPGPDGMGRLPWGLCPGCPDCEHQHRWLLVDYGDPDETEVCGGFEGCGAIRTKSSREPAPMPTEGEMERWPCICRPAPRKQDANQTVEVCPASELERCRQERDELRALFDAVAEARWSFNRGSLRERLEWCQAQHAYAVEHPLPPLPTERKADFDRACVQWYGEMLDQLTVAEAHATRLEAAIREAQAELDSPHDDLWLARAFNAADILNRARASGEEE